MKSLWMTAQLATCGVAVLLMGSMGAAPSPAFEQGKKEAATKPDEPLDTVRKSAEQGEADAEFKLGQVYFVGQGLAQDYVEAARWYRKAAEQGHADAQCSLGGLYAVGQGVTQDYPEAARWYKKAADQGQSDAQKALGYMYEHALGVPQDFAEAVHWHRKAAARGQSEAPKLPSWVDERSAGTPQDSFEASRSSLSDDAIQKALDSGSATTAQAVWKTIEKHHAVRINRQSFADSVGKTAVFLTDRDLITLAASEAARRHRGLTVGEVKRWSNLGTTHVLLVAVAGGIYVANLPKWQAPAVHMTITAVGREIQPLSESRTETRETQLFTGQTGVVTRSGNLVTYTPLYESALYDVARSRTWFSFDIPPDSVKLTVTVISADGHEKYKEFDPSVLK